MNREQVGILDEFKDDISAVCQEVIDLRETLEDRDKEIEELEEKKSEVEDELNRLKNEGIESEE